MMIDGVLNGSPASVKVPSRLESEDKKVEIPTSQSFVASGIPIPNSSYQHGEAIAQNTPEFHVSNVFLLLIFIPCSIFSSRNSCNEAARWWGTTPSAPLPQLFLTTDADRGALSIPPTQ